MQWLIDIIKAWIIAQGYATEAWVLAKGYLTGAYVDRGDPATADYTTANFIANSAWHDKDLSGLVPAGAKAVHLIVYLNNMSSAKYFYVRKKGNINEVNKCGIRTFASYGNIYLDWLVACDSNRVIQYKAQAPASWIVLNMTVKGWIL